MTTYTSHLDSALITINGGLKDNLAAAVAIIHGQLMVKMLQGTRSGKTYLVPGTKREYTASAPGEPPAPRTGNTARTYDVDVDGFVGRVGSPSEEALRLERGTSRMAPRPHLKPAFDESLDKVKQALGNPIK